MALFRVSQRVTRAADGDASPGWRACWSPEAGTMTFFSWPRRPRNCTTRRPAIRHSTAPMDESRIFHTATRLADGTVLVAGGYRASPPGGNGYYVPMAFSEAELYDPAVGRWQRDGQSWRSPGASHGDAARRWHCPGCRRLRREYRRRMSWAEELYDPVNATWVAAGTSAVGAVGTYDHAPAGWDGARSRRRFRPRVHAGRHRRAFRRRRLPMTIARDIARTR